MGKLWAGHRQTACKSAEKKAASPTALLSAPALLDALERVQPFGGAVGVVPGSLPDLLLPAVHALAQPGGWGTAW